MNRIVVCIDNSECPFLTLNKTYLVCEELFGIEQFEIENDNNKLIYYRKSRFISLKEYRKNQIFKLIYN